jgi:hypothetical protein
MATALAALKLLIHLPLANRHGIHGDELYFVACGRHPAFGYVDHGPFVPWVARASEVLFGHHVWALRIAPQLAGAATIFLTVSIVAKLGGERFAQLLAGLGVLIAPSYLRVASILCLPAFEMLFWTAGAYVVLLMLERERPKLWLLLGVIIALGFYTKHVIVFWCFGLAAAYLVTDRRRLARPWPWAGALVALLLIAPHVLWQVSNGWPSLEFMRASQFPPRTNFLFMQLLYMHPFASVLSVAGVWFFFSKHGSRFRVLGWMFVATFAAMLAAGAKAHFLMPAYPPLYAGGAVAMERLLSRAATRAALVGVLGLGGALMAPMALPILSLSQTDAYIGSVFGGLFDPKMLNAEYHDEVGWQADVEDVAQVFRALPADEQRDALVLGETFKLAGAIDYYGPSLGLPHATSGHMTYALWSRPDHDPRAVVALGYEQNILEDWFEEVREVKRTGNPDAWYVDVPIFVCRRPRGSIAALWPEMKVFALWPEWKPKRR